MVHDRLAGRARARHARCPEHEGATLSLKVEYVEEGLCRRHLDVEVPAETVTEAFDKQVARYSRTLRLPGFRKGKIPKDLVKNRYRAEILNQIVQDIVPDALGRALDQRSLRPISEPEIGQLDVHVGKPLRFRASFEVMPRIEVKDYKGLEVKQSSAEVAEGEVEKRLEALRERAATYAPVEDRGAKDGDFVRIDIRERPAEGKGRERAQEGVLVEVGSDAYHPALHEALQSTEPGDTPSFTASFAGDHPDSERAGHTFEVDLEVKELKEKVLPALDDDFAKDLGELESLAQLREQVRKQAEAEAKHQADQDVQQQLMEKLLEANPFEPPRALVEHELDRRVEDLARSLIDRGVDPRKAGIDWAELRESQRESATRSVAATMLLDRLAEQEQLRESEEDVDREVEAIAKQVKKGTEAVRAQLMKDGTLERIRRRLRRELAVDLLRQNARIQRG